MSTTTDSVDRWLERRDKINRENALYSTGPRTDAGKRRSSLNALSHGLTASSPVVPGEDRATYEDHCRGFYDEYKPATSTESQLVREVADTAWRLNRIPRLEAALLDRANNPPYEAARYTFDIVDAHRALTTLGLHGTRLSRQFQKALATLRDLQSSRAELQRRELRNAAHLYIDYAQQRVPFNPAEHGFVFSKEQVELHAQHILRHNAAWFSRRDPVEIASQVAQ